MKLPKLNRDAKKLKDCLEATEKVEKAEAPRRSVTFTLDFGKAETLKTIQEAFFRARSLGVPDDAQISIRSHYASLNSYAIFSWTEPMA